jgi:hypothetical protein
MQVHAAHASEPSVTTVDKLNTASVQSCICKRFERIQARSFFPVTPTWSRDATTSQLVAIWHKGSRFFLHSSCANESNYMTLLDSAQSLKSDWFHNACDSLCVGAQVWFWPHGQVFWILMSAPRCGSASVWLDFLVIHAVAAGARMHMSAQERSPVGVAFHWFTKKV